MSTTENGFPNTLAALVIHDQGREARQQLWDKAASMHDVDAAAVAENAALKKLQDAFYEDTKHVNSLAQCRHADVAFMRMCAAGDTVTPSTAKTSIEDRIGGWKR